MHLSNFKQSSEVQTAVDKNDNKSDDSNILKPKQEIDEW